MPSQPMLQVTKVTKRFGNLVAVDDVSLQIDQGQILGLIGPNGAGKTTLFNVISGLYRPDSGHVYFQGVEISGLPPYRICQLGMSRTFQVVKAFSNMSVAETVRVGAYNRCTEKDVAARVDEVIELCELGPIRRQRSGDLQFAALRRVELARAMATGARLLLLDEAGAGLNPMELKGLMDLLRRLNETAGLSFCVVEHVMQMVMGLCHRIVVLETGRVIAEGNPSEISGDKRVIEAYLGTRGVR